MDTQVSPDDLRRRCYYCDLPMNDNDKAIQAKTGNAWAHFTCWFEGGPFERDMQERKKESV
jgi:hypothetical protein